MITTPNPRVAFHTASMFQQIDLGVLLRPAYDVFKEEQAGAIIAWLCDMCSSHICGDPDAFKRILARALCEAPLHVFPRNAIAGDLSGLQIGNSHTNFHDVVRLDWLMRLDVRMWKKAKWHMRQIYASLYHLGGDIRDEMGKSSQVQ
jgi:E3 ubiquitin-protein ligase UBR1